jgi:hypothetical protein
MSISLDTIVARSHMYTYAAKVWALSIAQGAVSVAPSAKPQCYDSKPVSSLYACRTRRRRRTCARPLPGSPPFDPTPTFRARSSAAASKPGARPSVRDHIIRLFCKGLRGVSRISRSRVGLTGLRRRTAIEKLRIVTSRVGTGRQKMVLERWTNPTLSRRTSSPRYGLQCGRGKSAGVVKQPRERSPTRNP